MDSSGFGSMIDAKAAVNRISERQLRTGKGIRWMWSSPRVSRQRGRERGTPASDERFVRFGLVQVVRMRDHEQELGLYGPAMTCSCVECRFGASCTQSGTTTETTGCIAPVGKALDRFGSATLKGRGFSGSRRDDCFQARGQVRVNRGSTPLTAPEHQQVQ